MLLGALEAGGTKMICAIGHKGGEVIDQISIPTETPEITLPKIIEYFKNKNIKALGIGSFGPIDLNKHSKTYGYITTTPKVSWTYCDLVGTMSRALNVPIGFDTDVNTSALGEATFGITKNLETSIYMTVGTGIGMGAFINGQLHHGMLHPEAGHVLLVKHSEDTYKGHCPFHTNCLEGLASGPAIEERWGKKAFELANQEKVWEMEAFYLAQGLVGSILTISPQRIVLGGGVLHQEQLLPMIRLNVKKLLNGYICTKEIENLDQYIVRSSLNDRQGILGCLKLATIEISDIQCR